MPVARPTMFASAMRRIENAVGTEVALQAGGQLEYAAFAFDQLLLQILLAAAIGDVFPENHNALIAPHLVAQAWR